MDYSGVQVFNFFHPITVGQLKELTSDYLYEWKPYRIFYAPCQSYILINYRTGALAHYPDIESALEALDDIKFEHEEYGEAYM